MRHSYRTLLIILLLTCKNFAQTQSVFNDTLAKQLDSIYGDDQKYRAGIDNAPDTAAYTVIVKKLIVQDSINKTKVCAILDRYGWLGPEEVGENGVSGLWYVIQHSDLHTMVKYLPVMIEAVKSKKLSSDRLALVEDRLALWQGRKQIYGSQVSWNAKTKESYLVPLDDPDNVDKRRAAVGLPPLADYLRSMDIKWDPEQHKKDMAALEALTWTIPYYDTTLFGDVGEIAFDERYDNSAFRVPDSFKIFVKPHFKGGKPAINTYFKEGYTNASIPDANGYVTVHFFVNGQGRPGKFRIETMDFQYQPMKFDRSVSFQIMYLIWQMKGWEPLSYKEKTYGYYCYLNFKIIKGQIDCITP